MRSMQVMRSILCTSMGPPLTTHGEPGSEASDNRNNEGKFCTPLGKTTLCARCKVDSLLALGVIDSRSPLELNGT